MTKLEATRIAPGDARCALFRMRTGTLRSRLTVKRWPMFHVEHADRERVTVALIRPNLSLLHSIAATGGSKLRKFSKLLVEGRHDQLERLGLDGADQAPQTLRIEFCRRVIEQQRGTGTQFLRQQAHLRQEEDGCEQLLLAA